MYKKNEENGEISGKTKKRNERELKATVIFKEYTRKGKLGL